MEWRLGQKFQVLELPPIPTLVASLLSNPVRLLVDDGLVSSENSRYVRQNNFLTLLSLLPLELSSLLSLLQCVALIGTEDLLFANLSKPLL